MGAGIGQGQDSRRRVLFVTSSFPRWAGDSSTPFVLHLAQDIQELGWNVHVLAPHAEGAAHVEVLDGVSVARFRYWWPDSAESVCYQGGALLNLRRSRRNYAKLPFLVASEFAAAFRCLAGGGFSLVHSHWLLPQGFVAGMASRLCSIPHVATIHGGDAFALRGRALTRFKRAALRRADAITVNSSASESAVRAIDRCEDRLHRIPMGATVPAECDPAKTAEIRARHRRGNGPLLLFVGRLIEEKGVGDLLAAIAELVVDFPQISALIVGDGPDRHRFQTQASDLGLAGHVEFAGWVEPATVASYMRAADIYVGPSKKSPEGWVEAQGIVFVEAMLAGTPVISCATGGVADVVRHEDTGLLVQESRPSDIAAAVRRLQNDAGLAERLVGNAYSLVNRGFTRQACATRFSALYVRVLDERARGSR